MATAWLSSDYLVLTTTGVVEDLRKRLAVRGLRKEAEYWFSPLLKSAGTLVVRSVTKS